MSDAQYLIRKHGRYYRPNSQGYTTSAIQAGRYTLAEAVLITHPNGPNGPRDGMTYVHEDEVRDDDLVAYRFLQVENAALQARVSELEGCLDAAEKDGICSNGNLWRFWSRKAQKIAEKNAALVEAAKDAVVAMQEARSVVVSKREHALLTSAVSALRAAIEAAGGESHE